MSWRNVKLGEILTESRIISEKPDVNKRITVRLKVLGVEKRGIENEVEGATKQYIRKAGQFIYGKQNFHKGAFGIIPKELDGFESSQDLPAFDIDKKCLPAFLFYFFKQGNYYLELSKIASGVATQRINTTDFLALEIPLPDIETQKKVIADLLLLEKKGTEITNELNLQHTLLKKLRQQLLQDAIQGKLLPQDKTDEPAAVLLQKIKAEKEALAKTGKTKKEKPVPPIKADEVPFALPEGWVWCRLGELAYITSGNTPPSDSFVTQGIPFLKMYNLRNQQIDFYHKPQFIKPEVHNGLLKRSRAYPGDILMNIVGPPLGKLAIIPEEIIECNFNQAAVLIRPHFKMVNNFIFWYLNEKSEIHSIETKGIAGQNNISVTQAHNMKIPLPPLAEQQRIVKKLDELMAACDALEAGIQHSAALNEQLMQQVLREALQPATVAET